MSSIPQDHPADNLLQIALAYVQAGRSVLPIAPGSKIPSILDPTTGEITNIIWKPYQQHHATRAEIRQWFNVPHPMGLALACGPSSGVISNGTVAALEVMDFDCLDSWEAFEALATAQGLEALLARLIREQTPRPGIHLAYACVEVTGNTKLASEKVGTLPNGKDDVKTLIETRGRGGQVVVSPTPVGIHPECPERGYTVLAGDWTQVPVITPEERQTLLQCARALNRYVPEGGQEQRRQSHPDADVTRIGDDYNARVEHGAVRALLEGSGWETVFTRHGVDYLRRPGKGGRAWSATLGYVAPKVLYVFSSNAAPFDNDRAYDPFGVYARLDHGGDFRQAAKALAEYGGFGRNGQPGDDRQTAEVCDEPASDISVADVLTTFKQWLDLPDTGFVEILLGAYVANLIPGDPVWLLGVGPSSGGKTEPLLALTRLPRTHLVSTITEGALLSGTPSKDKAKGAKGGILRELNTFGYLIAKDFTSLLSMQDKIRMTTLAALREIYDGSWTRPLGIDGGKVLSWKGKVAMLCGCTDTIDSHYAVIATMGQRFMLFRLPKIDAHAQAAKAFDLNAKEVAMREDLRNIVAQFFRGRTFDHIDPAAVSPSMREHLIQLAMLTVVARSPVERDPHKRDITLIPDPEAPARATKVIGKLWAALRAIGITDQRAWELVRKVGLDSMPKLRQTVLLTLAVSQVAKSTTDIAIVIDYPTQTTRRALEDLAGHKVIKRAKIEGKRADHWMLTDEIVARFDAVPRTILESHFTQ